MKILIQSYFLFSILGFMKGPVSVFVGHIPLPSLESRINRNHEMGANLTFLLGFCRT